MTRQTAIEAMCRECCYDELDDGTWRMQIERCELTNCPLYQYRPVSRSKSNDKDVFVLLLNTRVGWLPKTQ